MWLWVTFHAFVDDTVLNPLKFGNIHTYVCSYIWTLLSLWWSSFSKTVAISAFVGSAIYLSLSMMTSQISLWCLHCLFNGFVHTSQIPSHSAYFNSFQLPSCINSSFTDEGNWKLPANVQLFWSWMCICLSNGAFGEGGGGWGGAFALPLV